jgi:hypothetical protein
MPPERRKKPTHGRAISVLAVGTLLVVLLADGATPEAFTGTGGDDGWIDGPSLFSDSPGHRTNSFLDRTTP